jgi:hypothetical protein
MRNSPKPFSTWSAACPGLCGPHGMDVVQHDDTPCHHAGSLSLDGSTKVSEGSTVALYTEGDIRIIECQC